MSIFVKLAIGALWGYSLHRTREFYIEWPAAWRNVTAYSIGVLATLPIFLWVYSGLTVKGERAEQSERVAVAYLLSFLAFGSGVLAGWMVDPYEQ